LAEPGIVPEVDYPEPAKCGLFCGICEIAQDAFPAFPDLASHLSDTTLRLLLVSTLTGSRSCDPRSSWSVREQRVVVLNGPAGVGKTTTARALAGGVDSGACIHGDDLRDFIVTRREGSVRGGLGYRNGATIATNFIDAGYDLVVFEYVFESPGALEQFATAYAGGAPVHLYTLWAPLEVIRRRERARAGRRPLGKRLEECYRAIDGHLYELGQVIHTDSRTVDDVVAEIVVRSETSEAWIPARDPLALAS
jgi:chloramphenicol 3-O-phosphotransferase